MEKLIFQKLTDLKIKHTTYEHEALFTCEQAIKIAGSIPSVQCKNLFLKDDKKNMYLIVAVSDSTHETIINLKKLSQYFKAPGLRFADAELLHHYLNVTPGSVTPFGLIFDTEHKVTIILDSMLFDNTSIGFHPLRNTATTVISPQDLITFVKACNNIYTIINFKEINNAT